MPKYINADDLVAGAQDFLKGVFFVSKGGQQSGKTMALVESLVRHVIQTAPAEDVEPVVRCKDCGRRMVKITEKETLSWCKACGYRCNDDNWYCPVGRRKNEFG